MRRRDFLKASCITLANLLYPIRGRTDPVTRAAIVIGINKVGNLPVLRAAASGAKKVADWLTEEGFDVHLFIDDQRAVKFWQIFDAVNRIVDRGIYDQLVVYFSGHGFLNSYSELWMLSDAPNDPNAAVSLIESTRLSKRTGIQNVVFISDACRSTASSLEADSMRGSIVFPTKNNSGNITTKVDRFLATQEGDPAYEVGVDIAAGEYQGIYTVSFMDAFTRPEPSIITKTNGMEVVLNKDLEGYLRREVPRRAQAKSIKLRQRPMTEVLSNRYIGRIKAVPRISTRRGRYTIQRQRTSTPEQPTIDQVADVAFEQIGFGPIVASSSTLDNPKIRRFSEKSGFEQARDKVLSAQAPGHFETQTGLSVNGATVASAVTNRNVMRAEVLPHRRGEPSLVRLAPRRVNAGSVALQFSDGSGTVVAGLRGYIGTIVVDEKRVVSVSYVPSNNNSRWDQGYESRLNELRALVATTARYGTFRIGGRGDERKERARRLADRIRVLKSVDPTLGIYAAYAYAEADMIAQVRSVRGYMRNDLGADIFDVALLARGLGNKPLERIHDLAPFCPMLSQGWGLLRIENVTLPPEVDEARDHILPALWTTFRSRGMELLMEALNQDQLL